MFRDVNAVKTPIRNLLSVNSVFMISFFKSFYLTSKDPNKEEEKKLYLNPQESIMCFKKNIKDE